MCVVVVRDESAVVEGEREKMPLGSLGLIDCEGMMERGNEVGSGYANACLLQVTNVLLSIRDIKTCTVTPPFERTIKPSSVFYPFVVTRNFGRSESSRYTPPRIHDILSLVNTNTRLDLTTRAHLPRNPRDG